MKISGLDCRQPIEWMLCRLSMGVCVVLNVGGYYGFLVFFGWGDFYGNWLG